jgi:GntR family transcriptional regulator
LDAIETSKTHRFYLLLKERIASGALAPGHRLPSEPALAQSHGLSRVTVRRALDGLEREGLIRRRPGTGTFVHGATSRPSVVADMSNMLQHLVAMGRDTRVKLLAFGYGAPPAAVATALRLTDGERTQHSLRVRFLDETPFSYLSTHVPERIGVTYTEADLAGTPLLALLERSGVVADHAEQTISATLAGPETAEALQVEIGSPLIALTRVVRDAGGAGVEHLSALYRPDIHAFHMELVRTGDGADRHWRPTTGGLSPSSGRRGAAKHSPSSPRRRP